MSTIKCLCCRQERGKSTLTGIAGLLPFEGFFSFPKDDLDTFIDIISHFPFYQWACDVCLENGSALLGDPKKQFYIFGHPMDMATPHLAYFDLQFTCETCRKSFVFSKEEQRYWYEELSFIVFSKPKSCRECRTALRKSKQLNTELSDLLAHGIPEEKDRLLRIVEIYTIMGKEEKAKRYANAARKK